jgi:hypothetical protein
LSLILLPEWSGTDKAVCVDEFFDTVGSLARIGNWSDSDKIRITVLKLTDVARVFYSSSEELKSAEITWDTFEARFLHHFRDVRPPQFHYVQHQTAC